MADNTTDLLCAIRTLNHWKTLHQPTYIGIRLLVESAMGKKSRWLDNFILWKFGNTRNPRYIDYMQIKGIDSVGDLEYRTFYAPSPITALAESWVLNKLSSNLSFQTSEHISSYKWPSKKNASRDYEYYAIRYNARNINISRLLNLNKNKTALIIDVKKFYPSINKQSVRNKFINKVKNTDWEDNVKSAIINICIGMLEVAQEGIPIGPSLSHVFGNIAMEPIDEIMILKYGEYYHRYVDDIVVVVDASEVEASHKLISALLEDEGLALNESKFDILTRNEWVENVPTMKFKPAKNSFEELKTRIVSFLALHPDKYDALKNAFIENGFALPIDKMRADSKYKRWQQYIYFLGRGRDIPISKIFNNTEQTLLEAGLLLRTSLRSQFEELLQNIPPHKTTPKKWHAQKKKYLLNRLLYLLPRDEYPSIINLISDDEDLYTHAILMKCFYHGNIIPIIDYPGVLVSSFVSLCLSTRTKLSNILWSFDPRPHRVDSVAMFILSGLLTPPAEWIEKCEAKERELIEFCNKSIASINEHNFSYYDEINTLRLGKTCQDYLKILNSRFNNDESIFFELLNIGEEYFSG
ncbi:MAG TPA: RNA-directed DNA polymerase [Bacteroidota bacterium]|nr:RNA-directed DNA polymerase [Bacteroidota bacterium]